MANKQQPKSKQAPVAKKTTDLAVKKTVAKPAKKRYNSEMITEEAATYFPESTYAKSPSSLGGYGEPVRHATTLAFPGNYSCEIWTGSLSKDWRNCPVEIDWVFGPAGIVQFQLPSKGSGIASIDAMHKPGPLVVPLNLPDFQAPKIPLKWWWNLADDILLHKPRRIFLLCMAGRGRTGTMLSILYGIVQPHSFTNAADLVRHIRTLGCDKWVEATEQLEYIADVLKIDVGDADKLFPKPIGLYPAPTPDKVTKESYATYGVASIETKAVDHMKTSTAVERAIELAVGAVKPQKMLAELRALQGEITGAWFDQNCGTANLTEMQASMVYILFRDHFAKFKKEFLANLSKNDQADFCRIVKEKIWR